MKGKLLSVALGVLALASSVMAVDSKPGVYGVIADFEGPALTCDVTPTGYMYVYTSQQSTVDNITPDEYGAPVGLFEEASDAPHGYSVAHLKVTLSGSDYPVAGFGFMFEQNNDITYPDATDQKELGGKQPYDYSSLKGIGFYVKGKGPWYIQLKSTAYVGLSAPERYDEAEKALVLGPSWEWIGLGVSQIQPANWSGSAPSMSDILSQLVGVHFVAKAPSASGEKYEIYVDYLVFDDSGIPSAAAVKEKAVAKGVELGDATPNPFNPVTNITFSVVPGERAALKVYDVNGNLVKTLFDGIATKNVYNVRWDGTDATGAKVASGVYYYRLTQGAKTITKSMILMK
jgi:hypothetical protein